MDKLHIEKNSVQETLIIPLYGRMLAQKRFPGLIGDNEAERIINMLDYDFSTIKRVPDFGVLEGALRSFDLVSEIKSYLAKHPKAAVINLGCGLDTLFTQADNGTAHGYNLDFSDVIDLRNKLLPAGKREKNIACDLNNLAWFDQIDNDPNEGTILVAAGVFYYFTTEQVRSLVAGLARRFPQGRLVFDATRKLGLKIMLSTYVKEAGITDVGAYFYVDDSQVLKTWSPSIQAVTRHDYFFDYHEWDKRWGAGKKLLARFSDSTGLTQIISIDFA